MSLTGTKLSLSHPPTDRSYSSDNSTISSTPLSSNKSKDQSNNSNIINIMNNKAFNRGNYKCGRCGQPKVSHVIKY